MFGGGGRRIVTAYIMKSKVHFYVLVHCGCRKLLRTLSFVTAVRHYSDIQETFSSSPVSTIPHSERLSFV